MAKKTPKIVCEEDSKHERDIINPIDVSLDDDGKLTALKALTKKSRPVLDKLMQKISATAHIPCEPNVKKPETILAKTQRQELRTNKPWFGIEHVRDTLRFRSRVRELAQVNDAFNVLRTEGVKFVKIDLDKLDLSKSFGWRCAAFDFRIPTTDQIVEYYLSFDSMINLNDRILHTVYEKWRNATDDELLDNYREHRIDAELSRMSYRYCWFDIIEGLYRDEKYVDPHNHQKYASMRDTSFSAPYTSAMTTLERFSKDEVESLKKFIRD